MEVTVNPIFLPRAPDRNPRTECACQPVAFMSSFRLAPPERFSRSRTWAVLLAWRAPAAFFLGDLADVAPLLAFFAGVAFFPDLALDGATWALCAATRGLLAGFGCSAGASASVLGGFCWNAVHTAFSLGGDYRDPIDHSPSPALQANSDGNSRGRRNAGGGEFGAQMGPDGAR